MIPPDDPEHTAESALRSYRYSAHAAFRPVPTEAIVARARRRTRTRIAAAAAAVVAAIAGGTAVAVTAGGLPDRNPPVTTPGPTEPAPSTSPSPTSGPPSPDSSEPPGTGEPPPGTGEPPQTTTRRSSSAPIDVRDVDWANTTIRLSASSEDDDCLTGRVRITDGTGGESGDRPHIVLSRSYDGGPPTYGDLTGDGRAEAVLWASCLAGLGDEDSSGQLLVVSGRTGELVGSWAGPVAIVVKGIEVTGGRLTVTFTERFAEPDAVQERTYRWNGTRYLHDA